MTTAVSVKHLEASYDGELVLRNMTFDLQSGQMIGIIGPNGAGKSTLMKAILGLIPLDRGEVELLGQPVKNVRKRIAYVPQRSAIDFDFPISVQDTVLLGTYPRLGWFRKPAASDHEKALQCLETVGLVQLRNRQIGELSGGQQQRVFLARALVQEADILFMDEPFAGVDMTSEDWMIRVLKKLSTIGKTMIIVHHDLAKAADYFDELLLVNGSLIQQGPAAEVVEPEALMRAYQRGPSWGTLSEVSFA